MKRLSMLIVTLAMSVLAPMLSHAQPAPIHNPVATRTPCSVGADSSRAAGLQAARATRVRYDVSAGREPAAYGRHPGTHGFAGASASDVRRDILTQLNNSCN
jgi:hypothetical protein